MDSSIVGTSGLERNLRTLVVSAVDEVGNPGGHKSARGDNPGFGVLVSRGNNAVTRDLAEQPDRAIEEDVGSDTSNDTVGDVVGERDDEESQECRDRVTRVIPVDLTDTTYLGQSSSYQF